MTRTGPKTSETSKKIIRLLKGGASVASVVGKGFPRSTVKYYYWKMFNAPQFNSFVERVSEHNRKRRNSLVK